MKTAGAPRRNVLRITAWDVARSEKEGLMRTHTQVLWQLVLALGVWVLTTPAVAQEPNPTAPAAEGSGSMAGEPAAPETDQALAERIRQGLQENAPCRVRPRIFASRSPTVKCSCKER